MYIPYQTETCQGQDRSPHIHCIPLRPLWRCQRTGAISGNRQGGGGRGGRQSGGNAVTARLAIPLSAVRVTKKQGEHGGVVNILDVHKGGANPNGSLLISIGFPSAPRPLAGVALLFSTAVSAVSVLMPFTLLAGPGHRQGGANQNRLLLAALRFSSTPPPPWLSGYSLLCFFRSLCCCCHSLSQRTLVEKIAALAVSFRVVWDSLSGRER